MFYILAKDHRLWCKFSWCTPCTPVFRSFTLKTGEHT